MENTVWMPCISMLTHRLWRLHSELDFSVLPFLSCKTGISNNTYLGKLLSGFKFRTVSGMLVSKCLIPIGSFPSHYGAMPVTPSSEKEKFTGLTELLQRGAGRRTKGVCQTPAIFRLGALWESVSSFNPHECISQTGIYPLLVVPQIILGVPGKHFKVQLRFGVWAWVHINPWFSKLLFRTGVGFANSGPNSKYFGFVVLLNSTIVVWKQP